MSQTESVSAPRRRVMLLFGGQSAEHDVSRVTAVAVARALDPAKYDVIPVGITTEGRWLLASEAQKMLASGRDALPVAFAVEGDLMPVPSASRATAALEADVVIPLLHGPYGEDGTVQGVLELAGLPYVGAGVLGSAIAMDKVAMKRMFDGAGLETARALTLRDGHDVDDFVRRVEAELAFPCFVKPATWVRRSASARSAPGKSCATRSCTPSRTTSGCSPRRW
jgi:D-alanine-D-alanine ligase